jgi:hypothetical protein
MSHVSSVSAGSADPFLYAGSYNAADVSWLSMQGAGIDRERVPELESKVVMTLASQTKYTDLTSKELSRVRAGFSEEQRLNIRAQALKILRSHPQTSPFHAGPDTPSDERVEMVLLDPMLSLCSFAWQHHRPREVTRLRKEESKKVLALYHESVEERARIEAEGKKIQFYSTSIRVLDEGVFATIPMAPSSHGGTKTFKLLFAILRDEKIKDEHDVGAFKVELKGLLKVSKKNCFKHWNKHGCRGVFQETLERSRKRFIDEFETGKKRFQGGSVPVLLESGRNFLFVAKKYATDRPHTVEAIVDVMPYTFGCDSLFPLFKDLDEISTVKQFFELSTQLILALKELFDSGLLHNDLKPENIFLQATPEGELTVQVADFGCARKMDDPLNETHCNIGTREYFPKDVPKSIFTDLFGMGVTIERSFIPILDKKIKDMPEANYLIATKEAFTEFAEYLKSFAMSGVAPRQKPDYYVSLMLKSLQEMFGDLLEATLA